MSYERENRDEYRPRRRRQHRRRVNPGFVMLCGILATLTAAVLVTVAVKLASGGGSSPEEAEKNVPDYVQQDFLSVNEWSRPGDELEAVTGVVLHYVGTPAPAPRQTGTILSLCPAASWGPMPAAILL